MNQIRKGLAGVPPFKVLAREDDGSMITEYSFINCPGKCKLRTTRIRYVTTEEGDHISGIESFDTDLDGMEVFESTGIDEATGQGLRERVLQPISKPVASTPVSAPAPILPQKPKSINPNRAFQM